MRINSLLVLLTGSLPLLAFQNPVPKLACSDRGFHEDSLVSHCEMREQNLGAPRGAIQIDPGMNGGVSVNGWDRADILVRARIETAADTDSEARAMTSQIRTASGGGSIQASGPEADQHHRWSVSYEVFVPRQSDVQAKAHNGGIKIADVRGTIQFDTVNGGVKLNVPTNYSAHFETATVNGGLKVDFPVMVQGRLTKNMSFDTGQGGSTIKVTTTNGGVRITRS